MAEWTSGYVKSNGLDIFYTRTGGDKRPILLAHGYSDDGSCWTDVAKLLEEDYDVVMYDAIGHGNSARIAKDVPINLALDMEHIIKGLGLEKPAIMGHSMGANTIVDYATAHADEVSLVILEDVLWFDSNSSYIRKPKAYTIADLQQGTLEDAIKLSKEVHPRHKDSVHQYWASSKLKFDLTWDDRSIQAKKYDWKKNSPKITCPTLLLSAEVEKGGLMTPKVGAEALSFLPNAQWAYIPHAGHTIRYEQFDITMAVVKNFLKHHYPA